MRARVTSPTGRTRFVAVVVDGVAEITTPAARQALRPRLRSGSYISVGELRRLGWKVERL